MFCKNCLPKPFFAKSLKGELQCRRSARWEKIIKNLEKLRKIVKIKDDKVDVGNFLLIITQLDVDDFKYGK